MKFLKIILSIIMIILFALLSYSFVIKGQIDSTIAIIFFIIMILFFIFNLKGK